MTPASPSPASPSPVGVLLAAGRGRRMGGGKMLRRLPPPDGRPLVVAAFGVLAGVCRRVIVVGGTDHDEVMDVLEGRAAAAGVSAELVVGDSDAPMLASIRVGLARARSMDAGATVLVHPGDVPGTRATTVTTVLDAAIADGSGVAFMPEHRGRGGHPVVLPPRSRDAVLALDDATPGGLRAHWESDPASRVRLPVDDPGCRPDVDTPEQLAAMGHAARDPENDTSCTN